MRFLMRFRVQNAPDPTLPECLFREASCGLERKVSHIIWRHPSFEFLPTCRYFVAALRDYKPVRGRLGAQNRIKIASKIACVNGPLDPGLRMTVSKDPEKNSTRKKYSTMVDTSVVTHRTWKRTKRSSWGGPVAEYLAVGWPLPRGVLCPHCVHHHHLYNRQEAQVSIPQQPCLAITTPDIILFLFRFVRVDLNVWLLAVACLMDGL